MLDRLRSLAARRPHRTAVSDATTVVTFAGLVAQAEACERFLRDAGARLQVLVALPSGPHFTAIEIACFSAGSVLIPIPFRATAFEVQSCLRLITPDIVVIASPRAARNILAAIPETTAVIAIDDRDPLPGGRTTAWAAILGGGKGPQVGPGTRRDLPDLVTMVQFTSGSTGTPKGILLTNQNQIANLDRNRDYLSTFDGKDVFCPVPQFHAMGNAVVLEHLFHGSPVHLANDMMYGEHLKRMQQYSCKAILATPNYFKLLIGSGVFTPGNLPCLESITIGASLIDQSLVSQIRALFPELTIYCRYGVGESVGTLMRLRIGAHETLDAPGLVGSPVPGVDLAPGLVPPGEGEPSEIRVKHEANAVGALAAGLEWKPLADEDGYLCTGDLGYIDGDGRVHLRGRISEFIKSNGYRINPFEIEEVLLELDGVADAVVVGVPDELSGQRVTACVELAAGAGEGVVSEMPALCRRRLSLYKVPHEFIVLTDFPRTHSGKPDRRKVASIAESRRASKA